MRTRKIGLVNYFAYGAGDFLGAGTTALTAAWLLYFYTTFCGLTPIEATFIFATARVLDAVASDPAERSRLSRKAKARAQLYSLQASADGTLAVYAEVMATRAPVREVAA